MQHEPTLFGGFGVDSIVGRGNDAIDGQAGSDLIRGGYYGDTIEVHFGEENIKPNIPQLGDVEGR